MNAQHFLTRSDSVAQAVCGPTAVRSACDRSIADAAEIVSTARDRLLATAAECQRRKTLTNNGKYYGIPKANGEEIVHCISNTDVLNAVVTRNHYGSLVLNAARTLFIDVDGDDVDGDEPGAIHRLAGAFLGSRQTGWQRMFDDLRIVLQHETSEGFRIYRTAAGFRLLATTHEFEPGSSQSNRLMQAVGADAAFVELCRLQNNFRAQS